MKFFIALSVLAIVACSCNGPVKKEVADTMPSQVTIPEEKKTEAKKDSASFTTMQWIDSVKDYGKIAEGQKLEVVFRFRNTGTKNLVIESVHPSCGCTVADPPKEPIAPGAEGEIKGSFDSNGKSGQQHKTISVMANTKVRQDHELTFTVEVLKK